MPPSSPPAPGAQPGSSSAAALSGPLFQLDTLLPAHVRAVADKTTPIPTLAGAAKARSAEHPDMVRGDIGQVIGVRPTDEILYGPPTGLMPLRKALAELANLSFALPGVWAELPDGLSAEHVVICTGAAEALSLSFECFGSGRRVGVPRGHWSNYDNGIALAGGELTVIDFFDAQGAFDPAGIERQLGAQAVAALVANFPCNPTGAVLAPDETAKLAEVARACGVVLIADEVYARLRYDGQPPQSLLRYAPGHAVSIGSASKEYLMPGGRVGYLLSTNRELTNRVMAKLLRARSGSPNVLAQQRLLALLYGDLSAMRKGKPARLVGMIRDTMRRRRDALVAQLEGAGMPTAGRPPQGTIFLVAELPGWWRGSDEDFCREAIERGLFSCIPGSAFGLPGCVRFSFGAMTDAGIARLPARIAMLREATAEATAG